jgi:hypothetical protein
MKNLRQKTNWLIDATLFIGVLISFWLDITGVEFHQWLGIAATLLATYHLVAHWNWFEAVTERFFGRTSGQARLYYLIDIALMFGFWLILITGMMISTWFDLSLTNYTAWRDLHIAISITTLIFVLVKIGVHWRWIINTAQRYIFSKFFPKIKSPAAQLVAVPVTHAASRRDFLKLMGLVSVAALVSIASVTQQDDSLAEVSSQSASGELIAQEDLVQSSSTSSCVVRCNRGCSYPGHCRRYTDSNGNERCDLGECI